MQAVGERDAAADQVFQGERMTAVLLGRLTHKCHIFEMNGESYRFHESMKSKKEPAPKKAKLPLPPRHRWTGIGRRRWTCFRRRSPLNVAAQQSHSYRVCE